MTAPRLHMFLSLTFIMRTLRPYYLIQIVMAQDIQARVQLACISCWSWRIKCRRSSLGCFQKMSWISEWPVNALKMKPINCNYPDQNKDSIPCTFQPLLSDNPETRYRIKALAWSPKKKMFSLRYHVDNNKIFRKGYQIKNQMQNDKKLQVAKTCP